MRPSLSRPFAVLQWALMVLILVPVALVVYLQLEGTAHQALRQDVIIRAQSLTRIYQAGGADAVARSVRERLTGFDGGDKAYLMVDAHGKKLAGNLTEWPADAPAPADEITVNIHRDDGPPSEEASVKTLRFPTGERLLIGSIALARSDGRTTIIVAALAVLLLMIPAVSFVSYLQRRYLKRQIAKISGVATAFADGDLTRRIDLAETSEEGVVLATALNRTFDRLQFLVEDLVFVTDALAHELRSPLTRLQAQLEKLGPATGAQKTDALARVSTEIEGMLRTINATLDLSRAEAEGAANFSPLEVCELIRDLWEVYEPSAEEQNVSLVIASGSEPWECSGNRDLLAQALSNLLDNALRYSHASRIELGSSHDASSCSIWVADNGIGIPEDQQGEARRKFGRLDRARTKRGSGLGLTFVQAIAELHGGELLLEDNKPGLRAVLKVTKPYPPARLLRGRSGFTWSAGRR